MNIQSITTSQLPIIKQLAYQIWPICYAKILDSDQINYMLSNFYALSSLEEQLNQGHQFVVLYENDLPVGFASYQHNADQTNQTKLHKLYVSTDKHKKGLGQKLMNYVIMQAAMAKSTAVFLNVNRYNDALHFYTKNNFEIIKEEDIAIGNGYLMEDYVMQKQL
ncbi:GNAT family N-acetyltransferase [Flavobacterium agricola]|uniref:GNAT family N-acetyltransferase n=1 Tax=Flavobacterium agricola TaxID=2870839 RepID=A0ABY6LZE6_9FLAO|nr:GNAT family N-acetyltransferase [Flavobacterium agricola]UYW01382.1 GNAT family N-acetyltransferase [Flavobacterium agricola]